MQHPIIVLFYRVGTYATMKFVQDVGSIELISSLSEGVVSYSIPQGMVRGASLELMDHTFDGIEDSQTGDLRGGLGQLVDGKYGWDNFKATSPGGQIKGERLPEQASARIVRLADNCFSMPDFEY